jgi:uncharacterized protein YjbJ (UPF0337 family)
MGGETIRNKADELKGHAKEKFGDLTDNKDLQAEGAFEKTQAQAKQAAHDAKERIKDAADDVRKDFGH